MKVKYLKQQNLLEFGDTRIKLTTLMRHDFANYQMKRSGFKFYGLQNIYFEYYRFKSNCGSRLVYCLQTLPVPVLLSDFKMPKVLCSFKVTLIGPARFAGNI